MVPHATDYMYMMSKIYVKDSLKLPLVSFHVKHLDQTLTKISKHNSENDLSRREDIAMTDF